MSIWDKLFKGPSRISYGLNRWEEAPERNIKGYLNAYGQIYSLFGICLRIASAVGEVKWRLYRGSDRSERSQVSSHNILTLLDYANEFQTGGEIMELTQLHLDLVGKAYWYLAYYKNGLPAEIWVLPPNQVKIIRSDEKFIAGYKYTDGVTEKILFTNEVIRFNLPDPSNPYGGVGYAQAAGVELDSEDYAGRWNRNFFYNSARPDAVIESENNLTKEQREELREGWSTHHQGLSRAHKVAILEGGLKYKQIQMSVKDMDFPSLRKQTRENLMFTFGMPLSVMGIVENVNRANAEAGEYTFARWLVKPRLTRVKNKLNEQLLPLFKAKGLELDFDEVVPETIEQKMMLAESGLKNGYKTINEARKQTGDDPLPPEIGDVLLVPLNMVPTPIKKRPKQPTDTPVQNPTGQPGDTAENIVEGEKLNGIQIQAAIDVLRDFINGLIPAEVALELIVAVGIDRDKAQGMIDACRNFTPATPPPEIPEPPTEPIEPPEKSKSMSSWTPERKEAYWKTYVAKTDRLELSFIDTLKNLWNDQSQIAVGNFVANPSDKNLFGESENEVFAQKLEPLIRNVYSVSFEDVTSKTLKQDFLNPFSMEWIKTRSLLAAKLINDTTLSELRNLLSAGFAAGESIPEITRRITGYYEDISKTRAQMIARTEVIDASAEGTIQGYKEIGVKKVEFYTALDERTCPECNALHGKIYSVEESQGIITVHPNCRCVWLSSE